MDGWMAKVAKMGIVQESTKNAFKFIWMEILINSIFIRPEQADGCYNISTEISKLEKPFPKRKMVVRKYVFILIDGTQKYRDGPAKG